MINNACNVLYALVMVFFLVGCASTELLSANKESVTVKADLKKPHEAQAIADGECAKYGYKAHLNQFVRANKVWATFFFDCKPR